MYRYPCTYFPAHLPISDPAGPLQRLPLAAHLRALAVRVSGSTAPLLPGGDVLLVAPLRTPGKGEGGEIALACLDDLKNQFFFEISDLRPASGGVRHGEKVSAGIFYIFPYICSW